MVCALPPKLELADRLRRASNFIAALTTCRQPTYSPGVQLRPPSYFALAALIDGPLHGYAIMRRASEMSNNTVRLTTGTLYSVLDRAQAEGLVVAGEVYSVSGRERRDYTLTPLGHSLLAEEASRLQHAATVVRASLRAATGGAA